MAPKRSASEDDEPHLVSKIQRIEHAAPSSPHQQRPLNNDFSSSVKRKLADSKRTGQACDRCKVRKIRCDGRPEGCTPCEQNRTPCRTTDRITGRATVRGHAEALESELSFLRNQNAELHAQLKEMGVEPRAPSACNAIQTSGQSWPSVVADGQAWSDAPRQPSPTPFQTLPQFKHGSIGDNYLGVAAGDSLLSHIKGTSLSIFGTEIDITDFMMAEAEYETSPMSYTSLIKISLSGQLVEAPPLPEYQGLKEYATWYLRSLNPYTMLVHKPAFMDLVWRFGNDTHFTPTAPEIVTVHMMLATIQYQIATRNRQQDSLLEESHRHYQYALSFYKELLLGQHTWKDVQALAMICHHLRNFPKPGAAWIMTSQTYLFAIELGLHRSVRAWADDTGRLSKLDIEMRKRIFWTLNALQVNLNGRLGRPMPISNEDIDVEFPEPMNDCLPGEEANLDAFHQCSFQVGIQIAKYTALELELYKTIYAVRHTPQAYVENLNRLESGIHQWKDALPYELRDPSQASPDDHIFTLYLEYWYQAYQLLLHHPAVCRSVDQSIISSNLDKCQEASQKMLQNCNALLHKKSLDIPWINTVVYIAATFTTLFISSARKERLSPVDMTKLQNDMGTWISVLSECDHFLGSGDKLKNAISKIIEQTLHDINDSIVKRTATESLARVALQTPQHSTTSTPVYDNGVYREHFTANGSAPTDPALTPQTSSYGTLSGGAAHPYDIGTTLPTSQQAGSAYEPQTYNGSDETGLNPTHAAALAAAASSGTSRPSSETYSYANAHAQVVTNGQAAYTTNGFAPQDWRQWTRTNLQPQLGQPGEYLNTATTLMTLGRGESQGPGNDGQGLVDSSGVPGHVHHWPELAFPGTTNGHMGH